MRPSVPARPEVRAADEMRPSEVTTEVPAAAAIVTPATTAIMAPAAATEMPTTAEMAAAATEVAAATAEMTSARHGNPGNGHRPCKRGGERDRSQLAHGDSQNLTTFPDESTAAVALCEYAAPQHAPAETESLAFGDARERPYALMWV